MTEEYEEGTYLHEFTEAVPVTKTDRGAIAVGAVAGGSFIIAALIIGGVGLLVSAAAFPFGLLLGIPMIIFAVYLASGTGAGVVATASDMRPAYIMGECPYCGHPREVKLKTGERVACGRCLNIIVIRGNRLYIPESRLKKFRKKSNQSN